MFPLVPFAFFQKTAVFDTFGKIVISRLIGIFFHTIFCIGEIYDYLTFHPYLLSYFTTCISYFLSLPKFAQKIGLFLKFRLGPLFAIFQKTAVFDTFGKIVISRLKGVFSCGFLHSRNLG